VYLKFKKKVMKKMFQLGLLFSVMVLGSCSSKVVFPISDAAPAATITAIKRTNKQQNYTLEVVAINLASADRMNPPGANYSIWINTKAHGVKNVGQFNVKNAQKSTFETITPFDFYEVFITVEQQGERDYPSGVEIGRVKM
jgi:hypothetical protein